MSEDYILDIISNALTKSGINNELVPGTIYIDTDDGTYSISINKCESNE